MRTALEVIRRLEWDPACCAAAVVVGYHDRILGEIVEKPLDAFSRWGAIELADENELAIPQHRVVYFKSGDAIVWDNRCILHRATPFESTKYRRHLERTTITDRSWVAAA